MVKWHHWEKEQLLQMRVANVPWPRIAEILQKELAKCRSMHDYLIRRPPPRPEPHRQRKSDTAAAWPRPVTNPDRLIDRLDFSPDNLSVRD